MVESLMVYIFTILLSVIFANLYQKKLVDNNYKYRYSYIYIILIILPFLLTASLRYGVGTDYFTYIDIYDYISSNIKINNILSYYIEPLFVILNLIAKYIFGNFYGVFFLSSLLFLFFSINGINNFKKQISIPFAVFIFGTVFYQLSFNNIRQMLAVSIIFYSFKYIFNRNFLKYFLFVLLAAGFHKTSLVCLLLYFLMPNKKSSERRNLIFYFGVIIGTIFIPVLVDLFKKIMLMIGEYNIYINSSGVKNFNFLLYILPLLFIILIFRKKLISLARENEILVRLMVLQIPIQFLGYFMNYIDRLSLYVSIAQILLIPMIIKNIKQKKWFLIIFCWYVIYYLVMFFLLNGNETYPYFTFFNWFR